MKLAIASGKGGTGKTTLAIGLALALAESEPVVLLDCDAEEPNGHLFLGDLEYETEAVTVRNPSVNRDACTGCGACADVCQFNAIARIKSGVMTFPELCHACGGCALVCPAKAITEVDRTVGAVRGACRGRMYFAEGRIHVGEAMSTPAIRAVKKKADGAATAILDCPPGTACPMVEAVHDADYALLVTEPTPFGLHDLTLAVATVRTMGVPFGVVLNRAHPEDRRVQAYCEQEGIPLLMEIPNDRRVAESYSRGGTLIDALPGFKAQALDLIRRIREHLPAARTL